MLVAQREAAIKCLDNIIDPRLPMQRGKTDDSITKYNASMLRYDKIINANRARRTAIKHVITTGTIYRPLSDKYKR